MSITLQKIAKLANVSVSTASKALRGSREVNAQTAKEVCEIARRHGYLADKKALTLRNSKRLAPKIAILCPEIVSIYYTDMATRIAACLEARGASSQIFICDFDRQKEWESIRKCMESLEINGVVGFFSDAFEEDVKLPLVCAGKSEKYDCVYCDTEDGIRQAVKLACERGRTRMAFVGEKLTMQKAGSFRKVMRECGMEPDEKLISTSEHRFERGGYDGMTRLLESGECFDFCLCAYDEMAIGALKALSERGIRVPEDVAVAGINDIPAAQYSSPTLTSVRFAGDELCEEAANAIIEAVLGESHEPRKTVLGCELVLRESFR